MVFEELVPPELALGRTSSILDSERAGFFLVRVFGVVDAANGVGVVLAAVEMIGGGDVPWNMSESSL